MPQSAGPVDERKIVPAFQGIRGYGFLAVFLVHYFQAPQFQRSILHYPTLIVLSFGAVAVTVFFVLSGYLIGDLLFETRFQAGFFKVFYGRRILRILPVYYATLIALACANAFLGVSLDYHFWADFLFIQNLLPGVASLHGPTVNETVHFWSLAIEMQFYLLWPLVVWMFRDRRTLLKVTFFLFCASWTFRLACPLLHLTVNEAYFLTPVRIDAILLGVMLALVRREKTLELVKPWANYVASACMIVFVALAFLKSEAWAYTYPAAVFLYPLTYLTAAAVVLAATEKDSRFVRACSGRWIQRLGALSYGMYVIHGTFGPWLLGPIMSGLTNYIRHSYATLVVAAIAFCLTVLLALLSERFVEGPAMKLRNRLQYGPALKSSETADRVEPVLANSAP